MFQSYFSSEGFLKGLVLSKSNVHLRPTYVEVLKFYGFQPDTAITQAVLTTMFALGNDTTITTNIPVTTTTMVPTTLTTMKDVMTTAPDTTTLGVQNKTQTSIPGKGTGTTLPPTRTTPETATEIVTATNKLPTPPEVLAMQGPTTTANLPTTLKPPITTFKPGETTLLTTIIGVTTKKEMVPTESLENKTVLSATTQNTMLDTTTDTGKTTITDSTTPKEFITTTQSPTKGIVNQETTTDMNVVTITNQEPPQLESMDMVLEKPNKTKEKQPDTTPTTEPGETTTEPIKSIFSQLVPVDDKEKKKKIFTKQKDPIPFSTMFVDTTIPFEELVILTTPPDSEVLEDKGSSMLEAIIVLEEKEPILYPDPVTDNTIKRSTDSEPTHFTKYPTTYSYFFSSLNGINQTYTTYKFSPDDDHSASLVEDHSTSSYEDYNDVSEETSTIVENLSEDLNVGHVQSVDNDVSMSDDTTTVSSYQEEEEANGFPTLEPDTIIFPTISDPRPRRSIKG